MQGIALRPVDIDHLVKCPKQWVQGAVPGGSRYWREWSLRSHDGRHQFALFVQMHPAHPSRFVAGLSWKAAPGEEWLLLSVEGLDRGNGARTLRRPASTGGHPDIRALPQQVHRPVRQALTPASALREVARLGGVPAVDSARRRGPRFGPSGLMM